MSYIVFDEDMDKRKDNKKIVDFLEAKEGRKKNREVLAAKKAKSNVAPKRKNRARIFAKLYAVIILASIFVTCTIAYRVVAMQVDLDKAQADNAVAAEKKARLENELEHLNDPENIEQQARTRLRMVKPDDVLYILPEDSSEEGDTNSGDEGNANDESAVPIGGLKDSAVDDNDGGGSADL